MGAIAPDLATPWLLFVAVVSLGVFGIDAAQAEPPNITPPEQRVVGIPLAGPLVDTCGDRCAELSGLAWHGDTLIMLPQYPGRFPLDADGQAFAISKGRIVAFLDRQSAGPILPTGVRIVAPGVEIKVERFQGYEAIAIDGHRVYVTIETGRLESLAPDPSGAYLLAGRIDPDSTVIHLDPETLTPIPSQVGLPNMSYEALVKVDDGVLAIHEANGGNVNANPVAHVFDRDVRRIRTIPFPTMEYRVTDATAIDTDGRFWVINYFWPGEEQLLKPAPDSLVARHGVGATHGRCRTVERLVQLRYTGLANVVTDTPPIQLELVGDDHARNWEGLVQLDDRGFLLVTDKNPSTLLGFVSLPIDQARRRE